MSLHKQVLLEQAADIMLHALAKINVGSSPRTTPSHSPQPSPGLKPKHAPLAKRTSAPPALDNTNHAENDDEISETAALKRSTIHSYSPDKMDYLEVGANEGGFRSLNGSPRIPRAKLGQKTVIQMSEKESRIVHVTTSPCSTPEKSPQSSPSDSPADSPKLSPRISKMDYLDIHTPVSTSSSGTSSKLSPLISPRFRRKARSLKLMIKSPLTSPRSARKKFHSMKERLSPRSHSSEVEEITLPEGSMVVSSPTLHKGNHTIDFEVGCSLFY